MLYKRDDTMKRVMRRPRNQAHDARPHRHGLDLRVGLGLVVLVALALRIVHVWQMRSTPFFLILMGDSKGYDAWAQQIAAGDWVGREVFYQAPLYPYFLAAVYGVFGHDLLIVRLVQAVVGATSCVLLGYAAAELFGRRAAIVAGVMLGAYPAAIFFDGLIQKSVLDVFLLCLALALCARIMTAGASLPQWVAVGAVMGALSLTRENALALAAVIAFWAGRTSGARAAAVFALGVLVLIAPVALRNYTLSGEWHLTTSQFGSNLYIGNNPKSDGSYMSLREGRGSPEFERLDATQLAEEATGRTLTPAQVSRYWTTRTLEFISEQPAAWLQVLLRKARLLVSRTEIIDTESQESHAEYSFVLRSLSRLWHFGVLLPIAVVGMFLLIPDRRRVWLLYALTAAYAISVVLFFVVARYRLPIVPLLILFAAAAVGRLATLVARRALPENPPVRWAPLVVVGVFVALLAAWPAYSADDQRAITENNLGVALQEAGRPADAIEHYRRALAFKPDYTPALANLGTALRAAGRVDEAIAVYGQVLERDAGKATVHLNMGNALMAQRRLPEAIASFRRAFASDEGSAHARDALANALYDHGTAALDSGSLPEAVSALRESLQLRPNSAEAHNNLGIALASEGKLDEAVGHWQEALRIKPDFADAHANLKRAGR